MVQDQISRMMSMRLLVFFSILLVLCIITALVLLRSDDTGTPIHPLRIATTSPEYATLTLIAQEKGLFKEKGLGVTISEYPTGVAALETIFTNTSDIAYASEFAGIQPMSDHPDLRIIACTAKSESISLLIRKDRNITSPSDLKNKTVALCKGTAPEFFLARYLTLNGLDYSQVIPRYLHPDEVYNCVVTGTCDAGILWEPYGYTIREEMGSEVLVWPAQSGQQVYWVAYTTDQFIQKHPEVIIQYMTALAEAEDYLLFHEQDARDLIVTTLHISKDYYDYFWNETKFLLNMDQGFLLALEDENRWSKQQNPLQGLKNILTFINETALRSVKPEAVTIIR